MSDKKCPFCLKGYLSHRTEPEELSYKGLSITVEQPGMYCSHCDEAIFGGMDLKVNQRLIHDLHAEADGYLPSGEVKRIRKALNFSQKDAAALFGGGVNAFSRYERGEARQSKAVDIFLRLLDADPSVLNRFSYGERGITVKQSKTSWMPISSVSRSSHLRVVGGSVSSSRVKRSERTLVGRTVAQSSENGDKFVGNG